MTNPKTPKRASYLLDTCSSQLDLAHTFGFNPIETPEFYAKNSKGKSELYNDCMSFLSFYFNQELYKRISQPLLYAFELPYKKGPKRKSSKNVELELHAIGTLQSVTDALAIKTALTILEEEGYKNLYIEINSVGDKESFAKLERDLISYYRKNINSLPSNYRQLFKKDIWSILKVQDQKIKGFLMNAPQPMNCLSDVSRKHFKEVLEFLDILEIPFVLNPALVGEKGVTVHTVFEIKSGQREKKDPILAFGNRYNHIAKDLGFRRDTPGLRVEMSFPRKKKITQIKLHSKKKPNFFFVQIGYEAKLRSIGIVDMLRRKKINIGHDLNKDKITEQMERAERLGASHIIIVGQREALEKSVVVRHMQTRSQKSILLDDLVEYLKAL